MYRCQYDHVYSSAFWLNAATGGNLEASAHDALETIINRLTAKWSSKTDRFRRMARLFKLFDPAIETRDDLIQAIHQAPSASGVLRNWFTHPANNRWLLLVLNCNDPDSVMLEKILPATDKGHVIVTTTRDSDPLPGFHSIVVPGTIGEAESVDLLIRRSGKNPGKVSRNGLLHPLRKIAAL
jgi:hypothetical protein